MLAYSLVLNYLFTHVEDPQITTLKQHLNELGNGTRISITQDRGPGKKSKNKRSLFTCHLKKNTGNL